MVTHRKCSTHLNAAGAIKYSPRQLMKMCDPVECEKQAVITVHLMSAQGLRRDGEITFFQP